MSEEISQATKEKIENLKKTILDWFGKKRKTYEEDSTKETATEIEKAKATVMKLQTISNFMLESRTEEDFDFICLSISKLIEIVKRERYNKGEDNE